jgi:hypothetical protein
MIAQCQGEFANRASSLGRSTLKTMRDAGYEVPEGGFQSLRDIDNLAKGPKPPEGDLPFDGLDDMDFLTRNTPPEPNLPNAGGAESFDFLTSRGTAPLSTMERLGARSAERFGRRYRPEF